MAPFQLDRLTVSLLLLVPLVAGCDNRQPQTGSRSAGPRQSTSEHLARALHFVNHMDEYEKQQAVVQATFHLNRWVDSAEKAPDWQADPLVKTLPRIIREGPQIGRLQDFQFQPRDTEVLLESVWMRDLAAWISSQPVPGPLADQLQQQAAEMDRVEGEQLVIAYRLFDWTVRSVQLNPLIEYPADPVAVGTDQVATAVRPPPMRGIPGPGYQYTPSQTLIFGHGDALNRARVFILLARQQGIPVVMLAFPGLTTPPRPRPWVTAAWIGSHLYLFDTQLGIPIPGPDGRSVATLKEVQAQPQLLSDLSVGDEFNYSVEPRDLRRVVALIDASGPALSVRLQLVQDSLLGDDRVVVSYRPSALAQQLQSLEQIEEVALWTLPFETEWFGNALQELIARNKEAASQYHLRYGVFNSRNSLVQARYHHIRGEFDKEGDRQGAKTLYLQSRLPNNQINQLESSHELQTALGLLRAEDEREVAWQNRLAVTRMIMTQSKLHASYWLGLAHFDTGRFEAAREWFRSRTLEASPGGPWSAGAAYNLARTFEALGEINEAREIYLRDDSVQQHGNVLRARLLRPYAS